MSAGRRGVGHWSAGSVIAETHHRTWYLEKWKCLEKVWDVIGLNFGAQFDMLTQNIDIFGPYGDILDPYRDTLEPYKTILAT